MDNQSAAKLTVEDLRPQCDGNGQRLPAGLVKYEAMLGRTAVAVRGCEVDSESMTIDCVDVAFVFRHVEDCCESVSIQQIDGDPSDLVGSPILMAEEVQGPEPEGFGPFESHTWTFYKFGTAKGYVTVRWLGESNGYYSESVCYAEIRA